MTMHKGYIDKHQLTVLVTLMIMGSYFLVVPRTMAYFAGSAGWLGVVVGSLGGVIVGSLVVALHRRFPSHDLMGMSEVVLGKWLGKLWSLLFFLYTLAFAVVTREFSTTILTPFLADSPIGPVLVISMIIMSYLAYSGIESIARTAQVFLPLIVLSILPLLVISISSGDIGQNLPWLGKGPAAIAMAGLNAGAVFGEVVVFTVILSHLRRTTDDIAALGWGIFFAMVPLVLITIGGVSLYGHEGVTTLSFPAISIARRIKIGIYFERLEAIFIILWFVLSMLKIGMVLVASVITLAGIFELKTYQPLVLPTALLSILLSLQFETDYSVLEFVDKFTTYTLPTSILFPGVVLLVAIIRGKREVPQ